MGILNTDALARELAKEAEKEIKDKVNKVFESVAKDMRNEIAERADADVYGVYEPKEYARRGTLNNPNSYQIESNKKDMEIKVTPIAEFNRRYGGWNFGNELGGFMNFGNYWHGYVTNYDHPMPRPYLSNYVESRAIWNEIHKKLEEELGDWADTVDFNVYLGDG